MKPEKRFGLDIEIGDIFMKMSIDSNWIRSSVGSQWGLRFSNLGILTAK
jgi:hypothetical protein